jgi:hypothetical protein
LKPIYYKCKKKFINNFEKQLMFLWKTVGQLGNRVMAKNGANSQNFQVWQI